ncbi:MAG: hypothetical protein KKA67_13685 [Spirochaetes bacterium]|nr:hypothetical protein [Spirochaetota bacterium]MBU1080526.1 hypothetical protein [Spirochaetota bacterium]
MGIRLVYGLKTSDVSYLEEFYPSRRLAEAARALGLDYAATVFPPGAGPARIEAFCRGHVALLRGELPLTLYEGLEAAGARVVNSASSTALAADKLLAARRFAEIGADHPRTVAIDPAGTAPPLAYPFVAKPRFGKMGRGVALIDSDMAWAAFLRERGAVEFIAQDYIAPSRGRDVRFFFADFGEDTVAVVERRSAVLASNAHAGGAMEPFVPPAGLRLEAERIFRQSGLDYGTVDFLFADDAGASFAVCETNACPGFEALELSSGLDAAKAILRAALGAGGAS